MDEYVKNTGGPPRWATVAEVANHISIDRATVYKWLRDKRMPVAGFPGNLRFDLNAVDAWLLSGGAR